MPEIFRDGAVYYPPRDGKALSEAILKVLSWDDKKRITMSERARQRASQFSWDECAEKTVEQLKMAIEEFGKRNRGKL